MRGYKIQIDYTISVDGEPVVTPIYSTCLANSIEEATQFGQNILTKPGYRRIKYNEVWYDVMINEGTFISVTPI